MYFFERFSILYTKPLFQTIVNALRNYTEVLFNSLPPSTPAAALLVSIATLEFTSKLAREQVVLNSLMRDNWLISRQKDTMQNLELEKGSEIYNIYNKRLILFELRLESKRKILSETSVGGILTDLWHHGFVNHVIQQFRLSEERPIPAITASNIEIENADDLLPLSVKIAKQGALKLIKDSSP